MSPSQNSARSGLLKVLTSLVGPLPRSQFFVYILASRSRVLYTGVTRNLLRRVHQHRLGQITGFTQDYHVTRLVHFEETPSARFAFDRERQIKGWSRERRSG
jgi:putative endonuclease